MSDRLPRIALLLNAFPSLGFRVMEGVAVYARQHGPWRLMVYRGTTDFGRWLSRLEPDGIIANCTTDAQIKACKASGRPVINTSVNTPHNLLPSVHMDNGQAGRLAAEHLLQLGYRTLSYLGPRALFSDLRLAGFTAAATEAGARLIVCPVPIEPDDLAWSAAMGQVEHWLKTLPKPVGLLISHDMLAVEILDRCRRAGVAVPDEVALVSIDNDMALCECVRPTISSVDPPGRRTGFHAAALLDQLMRGQAAPTAPLLLEPAGLTTRESTDTVACEDADVIRALRYIRAKFDDQVDMTELMRGMTISRRSLERRFQQYLGRTLQQEVRRVRLNHARTLLVETDMPLSDIATRCGFDYLSHLSLAFKKETGLPPSDYRKRHRVI